MDHGQAKIRIEELRKTLWENSRRYYVDNAPTMSDFEYDHLMRELEDLERLYPDLQSPLPKGSEAIWTKVLAPTPSRLYARSSPSTPTSIPCSRLATPTTSAR